jgi:hypothetical protein
MIAASCRMTDGTPLMPLVLRTQPSQGDSIQAIYARGWQRLAHNEALPVGLPVTTSP